MFSKDITIEQFLSQDANYLPIDVRSPGEFHEATIPGAINIPLFTNEERALVGTTYKQKGQNEAKWLGMNIVAPKLPSMLQEIKNHIGEGKVPLLFCWRGGMRSMSMATFAGFSGLRVLRITGGYRAFRQYVTEHLNEKLLPKETFVLHGMTGVGKTLILNQLKNEGEPVLDLEGFAGHRGSVFGSIGMEERNQKSFDGELFYTLWTFKAKQVPYMFIEAESRRIGRILLPDFIINAKKKGTHIMITAPLDVRVERIYEDYIGSNEKESWFFNQVQQAFRQIAKRLETGARNDCYRYLIEKKYRHFIRTLLLSYYDPRYANKDHEYEGDFIEIDAKDIQLAARAIKEMASPPTVKA